MKAITVVMVVTKKNIIVSKGILKVKTNLELIMTAKKVTVVTVMTRMLVH